MLLLSFLSHTLVLTRISFISPPAHSTPSASWTTNHSCLLWFCTAAFSLSLAKRCDLFATYVFGSVAFRHSASPYLLPQVHQNVYSVDSSRAPFVMDRNGWEWIGMNGHERDASTSTPLEFEVW